MIISRTALALAAVAAPVLAVLPVGSAEALCSPQVSITSVYTNDSPLPGSTHVAAEWEPCGRALLLKFKSRVYKQGRYLTNSAIAVTGPGVGDASGIECVPNPGPIRMQYKVQLKDGPTVIATSDVVSYVRPRSPTC